MRQNRLQNICKYPYLFTVLEEFLPSIESNMKSRSILKTMPRLFYTVILDFKALAFYTHLQVSEFKT